MEVRSGNPHKAALALMHRLLVWVRPVSLREVRPSAGPVARGDGAGAGRRGGAAGPRDTLPAAWGDGARAAP